MRKIASFLIICALLSALSGCETPPETLEAALPRADITAAKIYFGQMEEGASCTFESGSPELTSLLDELYNCASTEEIPDAYSPELRCTHRIVLTTEQGQLTLFYDDAAGLYSYASVITEKSETIKTYRTFTAQLSEKMDAYSAFASVPFHPNDEPPLLIDAILRADVIPEELEKPGETIDSERYDYVHKDDAPLYAVMTYKDGLAGVENGYLVFVAAWGLKPTGGYEIDISSIEENDNYYVVHVWHDTPAEGAEVSDQPTRPSAAALVDARRMMERKIVVFVSESGEILSLFRIDRAFLENIPGDMPPLTTPEPFLDDE